MAEKSGFGNFLLILIAIIVGLGFYWTISSLDLLREREETLVQEVRGLNSAMGRLNETIQSGNFPAPSASAASPGAAGKSTMPRFANLSERDPNAEEGDSIVMVTGSEAGNMNYLIVNEYVVGVLWDLCSDTPAQRNLTNPDIFEPELAESWEISEDKLTFTIHLRKGAYWHDFTDPTTGEQFSNVPVTSHDFAFFIDVIRNPGIPCDSMRVYYEDLQGIEVIDDYNFKVVWKKPYFMSKELSLAMIPLPRHFYRFDPANPEGFTENTERNRMIVGCGPWIFDKWEKGQEIVLRRNENYYGPKPYLKRRTYRIINEPNARLQALKSGEIDRTGLLPDQWVSEAATPEFEAKFNKFRYRDLAYLYIGYNMRREAFADRLTRTALTHLVDRQRVVDEVLHGLGVIITGPFFINSSANDKTIQPYPFDVEKAKQLLAEAGWADSNGDGVLERNGKTFEIEFMISSGSKTFERVSEIMREDFAKAGVVININPLEWSVFLDRMDNWSFDMYASGWSMPWEQDPYQLWHSSQANIEKSSNHVGFANAEADRLIEQARGEFDVEKRNELYHRFHQIIHEEQPYTFLFTPEALIAQDKRFRNAKIYPLEGMNANFFWVPVAEQKYKE